MWTLEFLTLEFFVSDLVGSKTGDFLAVPDDKVNIDEFLVGVVAARAVSGLVVHGHDGQCFGRSRSHLLDFPVWRNLAWLRDVLLQGVVG